MIISAEKVNAEDYYVDKYNTKFVQELLSSCKDKEEKKWENLRKT